jgi:hypothetical protein
MHIPEGTGSWSLTSYSSAMMKRGLTNQKEDGFDTVGLNYGESL